MRDERRAQPRHLAEASRKPGIQLRLLRFADGLPGTSSRISIFDFPGDQDPSTVFLENDSSIQEPPDPGTSSRTP